MGLFYLVQDDTKPALVVTLRDPAPDDMPPGTLGDPHNLTGATSVTLLVTIAPGSIFERSMTIDVSPTTGKVSYAWLATDWSSGSPKLAPGKYKMRYRVAGPGGAVETFPNGPDADELEITAKPV